MEQNSAPGIKDFLEISWGRLTDCVLGVTIPKEISKDIYQGAELHRSRCLYC
jgi:hypothetical protein